MSVYVDNAVHRYGRMLMCHMLADAPDELHDMAAHIGVGFKHFQDQASTPHYDICKSKRAIAVSLGAIGISSNREMADVIKKVRAAWIAIGWRRPSQSDAIGKP